MMFTMTKHMRKPLYLILLLMATVSSQEAPSTNITSTEPVPLTTPIQGSAPINASSLFYVKYYLKDESKIDVASNFINNITVHNITLPDILSLTQADQLNFTELTKVMEQLDLLSEKLINFETVEIVLDKLNISILQIYRDLRKDNFVPNAQADIPKILDIFGIDKNNFTDTVAFGTDHDFLQLLKNTNFTAEKVQEAFEVVGKSPGDLYEFIKPRFLEALKEISLESLVNAAHHAGYSEKHFEDVLVAFNVQPSKFDEVESFKDAFQLYHESINNIDILAVLLNSSVVTSSNIAFDKWNQHEDLLNIKVLAADAGSLYNVNKVVNFSSSVYGPVLLTLEGAVDYAQEVAVADEYGEHWINDCIYVTINASDFITEIVSRVHNHGDYITAANLSSANYFKIGSPLFCNGQLYGLAEETKGDSIGFRKFFYGSNVSESTTIFPPTISDLSSASKIAQFWEITSVLGLYCIYLFICIY